MKRLVALITMIFTPISSFSAEMLYRQSFETPLAQNPEIQWTTSGYSVTQAIVEHKPKHGTKSVRGNFNSDIVDPITGLRGEPFVQFKINFNKVPALKDWLKQTKQVYVSWWFKHDACHWRGTAFSNNDPLKTTGKFAFIRMNEDPATSYYFTTNGGSNGDGTLSANSWNDLWQGWYNRPTLWTKTGQPWGSDGKWHKLSFYIGHKSNGQKYMMLWINDFLMNNTTYEPDGRFNINNDFIMDSIQFWHIKQTDISDSTRIPNSEDVCNGWQVDDIQVWSDKPSRPMPPDAFIK